MITKGRKESTEVIYFKEARELQAQENIERLAKAKEEIENLKVTEKREAE